MTRLLLGITLITIISCKPTKDTAEIISINGIEVNKNLLERIENQSGKKFEPLKKTVWVTDSTFNGFKPADSIAPGIQISFVKEEKARKIVRDFLAEVTPTGLYIYLKNLDFDERIENSYYDIAVIKCKDQFELVKFANTSAPNYDITNEQVIEKLKHWNAQSPFTITVADEDRIEADFVELPKDMEGFAKDMYVFCPDVIDQGAGSEEELIQYFKTERSFWLWWD